MYVQRLFVNLPLLLGSPPADSSGQQSFLPTLITFGLIFVIFYFLIIRPQSKRQKDAKAMLGSLQKGDKVVSAGGIRGIIQSLKDDYVVMKIGTDTTVEINRGSISSVIEKKDGSKKPTAKAPAKKIAVKKTESNTPQDNDAPQDNETSS